jgi:hypothetical protein
VKRTQKSESVRVYADTSVFGGVFDDEFEIPTKEFFNEVKSGRFGLVTSAVVKTEIETAPVHVRDRFVGRDTETTGFAPSIHSSPDDGGSAQMRPARRGIRVDAGVFCGLILRLIQPIGLCL